MSDVKPVVFLLDDDPMVLTALSDSIAFAGYQIQCFSNPLECLTEIKANRCNLLISDVTMPEMTGLELLPLVKRHQPLVPILLITGFADIPIAVEAMRLGAVEFLEKPLDEETLLPAIRKHVRSYAAIDELVGAALKDHEIELLRLVAEGHPNKEIAYRLEKSIRSVESLRARVSKKLGADSTAALVKMAISMGIVDPE